MQGTKQMNKQLKYMVDCDIIKFTSFSLLMNFCFAVQKKSNFYETSHKQSWDSIF